MRKKKEDAGPVVNLGIPKNVYDAFAALCERRGWIKRDKAGALVLWFMAQRDPVKTAVLGQVDEGLEDAYAQALRELADRVEAGELTIPLVPLVPASAPPSATDHRADRGGEDERENTRTSRRKPGVISQGAAKKVQEVR